MVGGQWLRRALGEAWRRFLCGCELWSGLNLFDSFEDAEDRLNNSSTFETSSSESNGFRRKALAPDSNPAKRPNWLRKPVSMIIGTEAVTGSRRKALQTSNPFNPGNIRSNTIKSGDIERVFTRASVPLAAVPMAKPAAFKLRRITSSCSGSSSTTNIFLRIGLFSTRAPAGNVIFHAHNHRRVKQERCRQTRKKAGKKSNVFQKP